MDYILKNYEYIQHNIVIQIFQKLYRDLQVLLCEVDSDYSNLPQSIAVRSGPSHLNDSMDRKEFLRECRLLASLTHTNIVTLLGVAMSEEPYCTLLEHSSHGDLYHYLR